MKYVVAAATLIFAMQASAGYKWSTHPNARLIPEDIPAEASQNVWGGGTGRSQKLSFEPIERMYKWQWKR